jgi:DNA-binding CsgD family transcriptional regulator/tetratricopeptide (TPR) repeat protein
MSKPVARDDVDLGEAVRAFRGARFTEAAEIIDAGLPTLPPARFAEAVVLRARIHLKRDPGAALAFLARYSGRVKSERARAQIEMLAGLAYGRLGDPRAASAKFAAARSLAENDRSILNELAYLRGQVAWISRKLDTAEREIERVYPMLEGDLLLEARIGLGAIEASRGNVVAQGGILLDTVRVAREAPEPNVYLWAVAASQIAYLARELPAASLRDAAFAELGRIPWTADLAELHFTMVRAVAWRYALDGDVFNAFRRLKEAASLAPSPGWSVTASCDRAYFATVLGEHRWAEQERSDAQELAASVDWRSLDGEERFALLVLADLSAPHDASLALSYLARYKDAGPRFAATLASRDDRRVDAQEAHAFGVVRAALGDRDEAIRLFRESYAIYDTIGYDWRAGRVALALAETTCDPDWSERAGEKLVAYPRSWLRRGGTPVPLARPEPPEVAHLTAAQRAVYDLLVRGLNPAQVAHELGRSAFTVRNHIKAIFKVFGVNSRPALLARAIGSDRDANPR